MCTHSFSKLDICAITKARAVAGIRTKARLFAIEPQICFANSPRAHNVRAQFLKVRHLCQKEPPRGAWGFFLEQVTGIEPAYSAWEADTLPLSYTCLGALQL